jgi:hypothetical protein
MYPTIRLKTHQVRNEYRIQGATFGHFDRRQPVAGISRTVMMDGSYRYKYEEDDLGEFSATHDCGYFDDANVFSLLQKVPSQALKQMLEPFEPVEVAPGMVVCVDRDGEWSLLVPSDLEYDRYRVACYSTFAEMVVAELPRVITYIDGYIDDRMREAYTHGRVEGYEPAVVDKNVLAVLHRLRFTLEDLVGESKPEPVDEQFEEDKSALLTGLEKAVANGTLREFLGWEAEPPVCEHCGAPSAQDLGFDE